MHVEESKPARGGKRQGAGRPALPEWEHRKRVVLYLYPSAVEALRKFQEINSGPGRIAWDKILQWHLEDYLAETGNV